jgi:hypothetical protein
MGGQGFDPSRAMCRSRSIRVASTTQPPIAWFATVFGPDLDTQCPFSNNVVHLIVKRQATPTEVVNLTAFVSRRNYSNCTGEKRDAFRDQHHVLLPFLLLGGQ